MYVIMLNVKEGIKIEFPIGKAKSVIFMICMANFQQRLLFPEKK